MKKFATTMKKLWNDESGQGTAEYILLLVAVIMVAMLFKGQIKQIVTDKLTEISGDIGSFKSNN